MHSDREKLVEHLKVRLKLKYAANCKCGSCQCVPIADLHEAIAALSDPVKDEPVAWLDDGSLRAGSERTAHRVVTDQQKRDMPAAVRNSFTVPLYTRPAGERPAVAVEALEAQAWNCGEWPVWLHAIVSKTNEVADRLDMSSEQAHAFAALSALTAEPQAVPEGMVPVPTGIELRADEWLGELIYRALYEHEGGKWAAVEPRYVWYNAGARFRAMLAASPAVQGGE